MKVDMMSGIQYSHWRVGSELERGFAGEWGGCRHCKVVDFVQSRFVERKSATASRALGVGMLE